MLALQLQSPGMMGLGADGQQVVAVVTETIAERVRRIRAKMISIGIPAAVGTGALTMLTFAGAFGLARSERVWAPAIWLGAVTTVGALVSVALAAKVADDTAKAAATPTTTATPATSPTVVATTPAAPAPAAFYGYY